MAKIRIQQCAAASVPTPPAGKVTVFHDLDGILKLKKSDGSVKNLEDTDVLVAASAADTTPGYLDDKITVGAGLSKAIQNPGANENIQISLDVKADFYAHQQVAQTPITTPVALVLDTNTIIDSSFVYSTVTGELTINKTGRFKFTATVTTDTPTGSRQTGRLTLQRWNGASWVELPSSLGQSRAFTYNRNTASGENTATINTMLAVTSGQRFRLTIESISANAVSTVPQGCSFTVEEK